jgi:tRNA dimethylallyltransferase
MKKIIIITGPTASGKTKVALNIASKIKEENKKAIIINADASAVYKNFPILTASPSVLEKEKFPHFLYEKYDLRENFSVGKWLQEVEKILTCQDHKDDYKIIAGGTCMYIYLLLNGIFSIPEILPHFREEATLELKNIGYEAFLEKIKKLDPKTSADTQRLLNNYSLIKQTGKTFSEWQSGKKKIIVKKEDADLIKTDLPREIIYQNCNERFIQMVKDGALEEVKIGMEIYGNDFNGKKIIGYNELRGYILGEYNLETAISKAQQKTRNLAKSQATWLRTKL